MLAIEHCRLQRKGVHALHAAEVHDILARPSGGFAEGRDTAVLAKVVLRLLAAKLVHAQRAFLGFDPELPPGTREIIVPRLEQNEQLQRTPRVIGSASNAKRMAPQ